MAILELLRTYGALLTLWPILKGAWALLNRLLDQAPTRRINVYESRHIYARLNASTPWPTPSCARGSARSFAEQGGWFWHRGCLIRVAPCDAERSSAVYNFFISCVGFNAEALSREMVIWCHDPGDNAGTSPVPVVDQDGDIDTLLHISHPGRAIDPETWDRSRRIIQSFLDQRDLCRRLDLCWTQCLLLHGPPGTGKSTLVAHLAAHFKLQLWTCREIQRWHGDPPVIQLIEDVDRSQPWRKRKSSLRPGDLSAWLNNIDGVGSRDGVLLIFTANSLEGLPDAFLDRCLLLQVEAPTAAQILQIAAARFDAPIDSLRPAAEDFFERGASLRDFKRLLLLSTCPEQLLEAMRTAVVRPYVAPTLEDDEDEDEDEDEDDGEAE